MIPHPTTLIEIRALITQSVSEGQQLEFKSAGALSRQNQSKLDITKDVSAMANAAGGIIIYGIREFADEDRKHLPEEISPIDCRQFSREWLDQIIGTIQPRIDGLKIVAIPTGPNAWDHCYVVSVPQGSTSHQATDHKYYKRRNFEITSMPDYEVRDVMGRISHPIIRFIPVLYSGSMGTISEKMMSTSLITRLFYKPTIYIHLNLRIYNAGERIARHVRVYTYIPIELIHPKYRTFAEENSTVVHGIRYTEFVGKSHRPELLPYYQEEERDFQTLLPGLSMSLLTITLFPAKDPFPQNAKIVTQLYADDAPRQVEVFDLSELVIRPSYNHEEEPNAKSIGEYWPKNGT